MMQAASDIFLGWTKGEDRTRHYYWRQLRDMKGSVEVESMAAAGLGFYGGICGRTLARAHARSGDPIAIAAYLGRSDRFDRSISDFAQRYADQNELDHAAFVKAIRSGRLEAHEGL
jgi:predicted alpha/beta hydrolase